MLIIILLGIIFLLYVLDRHLSRTWSRQRYKTYREYSHNLRSVQNTSKEMIEKLNKENKRMEIYVKTIGNSIKMPPYSFVWGSIRMMFERMNNGLAEYGGWNKSTQETAVVSLKYNTQDDVWLPVERVYATRIDCCIATG